MVEDRKATAFEDESPALSPARPSEADWWHKQLGRPLESAEPKLALHLTGSPGR